MFCYTDRKVGKDYINELTRLLNAWIDNSALKNISFYVPGLAGLF